MVVLRSQLWESEDNFWWADSLFVENLPRRKELEEVVSLKQSLGMAEVGSPKLEDFGPPS